MVLRSNNYKQVLALVCALTAVAWFADSEGMFEFAKTIWRRTALKETALFHNIDAIQSFEEIEKIPYQDALMPRNLNILFFGDSVTRYQYLDLAYFLSQGKWNNRSERPNIVMELTHNGPLSSRFNNFFANTNAFLKPYEQCDCYRPGGLRQVKMVTENRYFYEEENNNTLTFMVKFEDWPWTSSWDVSTVYEDHGDMVTDRSEWKPIHKYNWVEAIEKFICKLEPKPSVMVFNAGLWAGHDLRNTTLQKDIIRSLKECGITSVYKTTTKEMEAEDRELAEYESQLCSIADYCMDLTWTGLVPAGYYTDKFHFQPEMYSLFNMQLLSLLGELEFQDMNVKVTK